MPKCSQKVVRPRSIQEPKNPGVWGATTPKRWGLGKIFTETKLKPRLPAQFTAIDREGRAIITAARGRQSRSKWELWRHLATLFINIFPSFQKLPEISRASISMPNFGTIAQKMRPLEGREKKHKTGSGAKTSQPIFDTRNFGHTLDHARRSGKVSAKLNGGKILRRFLKLHGVSRPLQSYAAAAANYYVYPTLTTAESEGEALVHSSTLCVFGVGPRMPAIGGTPRLGVPAIHA